MTDKNDIIEKKEEMVEEVDKKIIEKRVHSKILWDGMFRT